MVTLGLASIQEPFPILQPICGDLDLLRTPVLPGLQLSFPFPPSTPPLRSTLCLVLPARLACSF